MRRLLMPLFVLLMLNSTFAQRVAIDEAASYAAIFFSTQGKALTRCATVAVRNNDTLYYVFNATDGYAVISADRRTPPILAFSNAQSYSPATIIPPQQMWLNHYANQLSELQLLPYQEEAENPAWRQLRHESLRTNDEVAPLLHSRWGQGEQYNYYCPKDVDGEGGRVVTGCVATAMAQLMYYFRFPTSGTGTYSYTDSTYGEQTADYENTTYNFSAMCDRPRSVNTEIAKLMYHCGVGVDMVYGVDGSGMYNHSAAEVLKNYFKFSPDTRYEFRDSTCLDWDSLLVAHLQQRIPLYYAGWSVPNINGHAFICDGYKMLDSNYYYHFNFGWDGNADGYFYTNNLIVSGSNFNLSQELIIHAYPDTLLYEYPEIYPTTETIVLTSRDGSFQAGGAAGYAAGSDYTWIIRPDVAQLAAIRFNLSSALAAGDTLFVSTYNTTIEPLVVTSDTIIDVVWECAEITVRFVSAAGSTTTPLRANYYSQVTEFCNGIVLHTATAGTISDGSDQANYLPTSYCGFQLRTLGYPAIRLTFQEFDLEENRDFLHIYRYQGSTNTYLTTLTGELPAGTERTFAGGNKLLLIFETDEQNEAAGFEIDYTGTTETAIPAWDTATLSIYPTPTSECVYVETTWIGSPLHYLIYDVFGHCLAVQPAENDVTRINLSDFAAGIYFIRAVTDGKVVASSKIIRSENYR